MDKIELRECIRRLISDRFNSEFNVNGLTDDMTRLFEELMPPEPKMIPFEPKGINFIGDIKSRVDNFIRECKSLDQDQKAKLIEELGSNWYDERFGSADVFFKYGISFAVKKWKNQNFELKELWEKIAVANASVGDSPNEVADRVIEAHKNNFKSE